MADHSCNTCSGSGRHLTTFEEAPTELVDIGPCPDCSDLVEITALDGYGREILTVGQLRTILDGIPDHTHVVIDDGDQWWSNVKAVGIPDPVALANGGPYAAVSLIAGPTSSERTSP